MAVRIHPSWHSRLEDEFGKAYFEGLTSFVKDEYAKTVVFPHPKNIFRAFDLSPFEEVKVVILGQDPYHGTGEANGLCFSVEQGVRVPPSLQNIFTEIESDLGHPVSHDGDLARWAKQGVLLLNATLTVRKDHAGSHQGKGWEEFTDAAIRTLAEEREGVVFILWGNYARQKGAFIDRSKHLVLESAHPSPFAAHKGFFGNKHFSKANHYLKEKGEKEIDW